MEKANIVQKPPTPLAARSKARVGDRSLAGIAGSNPADCIDVYRECCVSSGTGVCDEPITCPEES